MYHTIMEPSASKLQALAQAAQAPNGAAAPQPPLSNVALGQMSAYLDNLAHLISRVGAAADRLTGFGGEKEAGHPEPPTPDHFAGRFSSLLISAQRLENSLRNEVERLERFV